MVDLTVVTANYGNSDVPQEQLVQDIDARWVCVSRTPKPTTTWENVIEPRPFLSDRMAAKIPKWRPDRYANTEIVLYIDGSVRLDRHDAVRHFIEPITSGQCDFAALPHPLWNTVRQESSAAQSLPRHNGQHERLEAQYQSYAAEFGDPGPDVYVTAVLARRVTEQTSALGDVVLLETLRWTIHDQLSLPAVAARMGIKVGHVEVDDVARDYARFGYPYMYLRNLGRPEDGEAGMGRD